jgi:acetyl-CoA C-acetyltransferase
MGSPVIVEAVRTAQGKRGGWLAGLKAQAVLGLTLKALVERAGIDPIEVGQVFAGCVTQAGEQGGHVGRYAWLYAGLPWQTGVTTVDAQCGSAQQSVHLAAALVEAGIVDVAIGCGVETMSRAPLGSNVLPANPRPADWSLDMPNQFEAAKSSTPSGCAPSSSPPRPGPTAATTGRSSRSTPPRSTRREARRARP